MAKVYKSGNKVGLFTVQSVISRGAQAISYRAVDEHGKAVFLKQYKSPSIVVPWFEDYIAYQKQLRQRIESSPCKHFCYRFLESFQFKRCFFQAFEFLDHSDSLAEMLTRCRKRPKQISPEQRVIVAKVMMAGIAALHTQKIVHADLKPDNIMLIRDETIAAGYRFRVIDMDFSILADKKAPWHGEQGYFGTPDYFSPEHVTGAVPSEASDVFTLGLMLYEILGGFHPYHDLSDEEYRDAIIAHRAERLHEISGFDFANVQGLIKTLHLCLHPDPNQRPSAYQVNRQLNGIEEKPTSPDTTSASTSLSVKRKHEPYVKEEIKTVAVVEKTTTLVLNGENGMKMRFNVRTAIGKCLARTWGDDSKYMSDKQFFVYQESGIWFIESNSNTENSTFLNGVVLEGTASLENGSVISVGNKDTGVQKMRLTVVFGEGEDR